MSETRSASERYLSARQSSHLRLKLESRGAADTLLAAGFASRGSDRKSIALAVSGMLTSPGMRGAWAIADELGKWLQHRAYRDRSQARPTTIERTTAIDLAMTVLKWHHHGTCPTCSGRKKLLREGAPVLDDNRECRACNGTGKIPIERLVRTEHIELARWLAQEIHVIWNGVFGEMNRRMHDLSVEMDLAVSGP